MQFMSHDLPNSSKLDSKVKKTKNVYETLSKLPKEVADKINFAATDGGRNLDAIWNSEILTTTQKAILNVISRKMNYRGSFKDEYQYISFNEIAQKTSLKRNAVIINLKKLEELKYIKKKVASLFKQSIGHANDYCITSRVFDEYTEAMIEEYLEKQEQVPPPSIPRILGGYSKDTGGVFLEYPPSIPKIPDLPVLTPLRTPELTPVCEKKFEKQENQHTHIVSKVKEQDATDLCEFVKALTNQKFINNKLFMTLIKRVLSRAECSLEQFHDDFYDLRMFAGIENVINFRAPMPTLEANLVNWILNKDKIIRAYEEDQETQNQAQL